MGNRAAPAGHPLVVSYYTPGTAYETNAMALRADLDRLGLESRIEPRPARPSWVENCAQKATFIRNLHREEGRALLWLDADARLRRPLRELAGLTADLGVVRLRGWSFYTGQILFGAGDPARRLLDLWCDYCERFPSIWDQVSLGYAWWDLHVERQIETAWLKPSLFSKAPKTRLGRVHQALFCRAPILQRQESRRSKAGQAAAPQAEFGSDDLPHWWRQAVLRQSPFPLAPSQRQELGLC